MAATAQFKLDFTQWDASLKAATAHMKDFEKVGANAAAQFSKLAKSFSGAQIQKEAKATAAAIEAIGGATKLTAAEQRKATATIDEAIAKYQALGEVAPAELIAIQAELKKVVAAEKDVSAGIDKAALNSLKGFREGAEDAGGAMSLLSSGMKLAFGGAVLGGMLAAAKSVLDFGGHLTDLSQTTGIATDDLQTLGIVGKKVGLSMDDIAGAVTQMSKRLAGGDASAAAAVQSLGLSVNELIALAPDQAFERIAAAVGEVENPMKRTQIATELLGRAGAQALPILTAELGNLRDAAKETGQVIDAETVKAMDDLGDAWEDVKTIGTVLIANVLKPMIPLLHGLAQGATAASGAFSKDWAVQTDMLSKAWASLKTTLQDIPGAWNNLVNMAHGGEDFASYAAGVNAAAEATRDLGAAQKGSISNADLANNRLKALREQAIAPLTAEQKKLIVELDKFGESQSDIAQTVGSNTIAVKLYLEAVKKAGDEAKEAAKKLKELSDQLSGKEAIDGLKRLNAAWQATPEAIRKTATAQALFLDQWEKLGPTLTHVPKDLQSVVKSFNALSLAAGKFNVGKVTAGLNSLEGIATKVDDSFKDLFADVLEIETKITKTSKDISAIINAAFKIDDRTESNFINTVLDLQDRLTLVSKTGLDRQLAALQISKAKELAALKANHQLTIAEYEELAAKIEAIYKKMEKDIKPDFGTKLKKNLEEALKTIPSIITEGLIHGTSFEDIAAAIGTQIGTAIGGAIGFALGGVLGEEIGKAFGSLLGPLIDSLWKSAAERTQKRIADDFGVAISEGLGQAIEDAADRFGGDVEAAKLFNLDKIIAEGGGLTTKNIDKMFAKFRDVFVGLSTGVFDLADAQDVLNKNFKTFADYVTKDGALASKQLLEIIRLNDEMGTSSAAVAEFVTAQVTNALGGLTQFLSNAQVTSQAAAEGIAASVFGAFEALTRQGASPLEAIKQLTPVLEQLDAQLKAAGFSGGAAFDQLRAMAALASDSVKGPLIEAITGLGVALEGLHNSGVLTEEMFAGLAAQVSDTYAKLIAQGTDGAQALQLIGPTLQTLWELQQDFGYAVDDATQALIDQGVAAGQVGDQHRSVQEKMAIAMDRTADAVEYLAEQFGYVAKEAGNAADEINKIPKNVDIKVGYHAGPLPNPDAGNIDPRFQTFGEAPEANIGIDERRRMIRGYARGGVVYAQTGMWAPRGTDTVPAMLTPGEMVLPRELVAALRSGGGSVTVHVSISAIDGADVERVVRSTAFRRALTSAVSGNDGGYRTDLRTAIGVR